MLFDCVIKGHYAPGKYIIHHFMNIKVTAGAVSAFVSPLIDISNLISI